MPDILIRPATSDDLPALTSLTAELGYPVPEEEVRKRFETISKQPEHKVVVAERDGKVVGLMSFHSLDLLYGTEKLGRITALVVTESERGNGIGKMLVAKAEEFAREEGCDRIELTSGNRRVEAHKFYESLGYEASHKRFTKVV
jgi:GNAT superfamily N-acetyltransferase